MVNICRLLKLLLFSLLLIITACAQQIDFLKADSNNYLGLAKTTFNNIAKVVASEGKAQDSFAGAIATDGDIMVVGASGNDEKAMGAGAAYVFERTPIGWLFTKKLTASDGSANDHFGNSVAVKGNTIVIGANGSDVQGSDSGIAYVFEHDERVNNWIETQKLIARDSAANDFFGYSVAVSENVIAVGAPLDNDKGLISGSAYIFERGEGKWQQKQKLTASDGSIADSFGIDLALEEDALVVGAWGDDDKGDGAGSAYVFERNEESWEQTKKLLAKDGKANDSFGYAVDIDKDTIVVGSWGNDNDNGIDSGSVYVFERSAESSNWVSAGKLIASGAGDGDSFGISVGISGNKLVVGASGDSTNGSYSGSAYIFMRSQGNGTNWQLVKKFAASDGEARDFFSDPVAISGNTVIAGARVDDDNGKDSGSLYVYEIF